ncbi:O-antigen ligase family protein [Roseateles sp.]|uniref:O-antigen ligase family protein n=1 Tax=Roseateles sp. TaxID=1971397 RepID=UPI003BAC922E
MKLSLPLWRTAPAALPALHNVPRHSGAGAKAFVTFIGLFLAAFFGLASAVLPWQYLVGLFGLPVLFLVGTVAPTVPFVAALLLLFGVMPEFVMAALPLGGATLRPAELVLIFSFITVMARVLLGHIDLMNLVKPIRWVLIVLACGLALGFFKGKLLANNTLALADARQYVGWLALPIGLWFTVAHPGRLQRVVIGIALLAATLMILQLGLGVQLIFGFRGAEYLSKDFTDVTRSAIGGGLFFLSYAAYRLFLHACDGERWRWTALFGCLIAIGGIVASFNRAVWAGFAIGAFALLLLKPRTRNSTLLPFVVLITFVCVGIAGLFLAKPRTGDAIVERVVSLKDEGRRGSSLGFRFDENQQALEALRRNPVTGIGMGGEYKRAYRQLSTAGSFDIEDAFIHNGYLSLWLKQGVFGLVFPVMLFVTLWRYFWRGRREQQTTAPLEQTAVFSTVILLFVSALTSPDFSTSSALAAITALLAIFLNGQSRRNSH